MNIKEHGFEIHPQFLAESVIQTIIAELEALAVEYPAQGIRNAQKKLGSIKQLVTSDLLLEKAQHYLAGKPEVVRVIVFDKKPEKNWLVTWHQDKTIAVSDKKSIEGWGPWALKDGTHHVQPPLDVLQEMVTFRIHLDDANEDNGCLKVIPKSHAFGILSKDEQALIVSQSSTYICSAKAGDLLIMRPHLVHSSSKGSAPKHRRIVHIEYSSFALPMGLAWA